MHWRWKNCPTTWKGQYTIGRYGFPTIILEVVASHDLHIWHAFFGVVGSNSDINVLNQSPLFLEVIKGEAPQVQFSVNGRQYNTGYYLADGIYPEWAAFMKVYKFTSTTKAQGVCSRTGRCKERYGVCFWRCKLASTLCVV
jgi:hypothetical protein